MATLKISDLSVGDWVRYKGEERTIDSIYMAAEGYPHEVALTHQGICCGLAYIDYLEPIPITPEILEANGWRCRDDHCVWNIEDNQGTSHDGEYVITWYASDDYLTISWGGREDGALVECTIMECRVKHIHQLQHALRLAGVDKEIVIPKK